MALLACKKLYIYIYIKLAVSVDCLTCDKRSCQTAKASCSVCRVYLCMACDKHSC